MAGQGELERESEDRPILTINRMPQFVRQVTGDMRQMRPSIKAVPVDSRGDPQIAEVIAGMIRYIENRSDRTRHYTKAADSQVAAGIGHWRVTTEYADDSTFNQEIRMVAIDDGVSVMWDRTRSCRHARTPKLCFVPVDISRESFKERWPDRRPRTSGDAALRAPAGVGEDFVRVARILGEEAGRRACSRCCPTARSTM